MNIRLGRRFWIAVTAVIVVVTLFVVGRNALHAVKIKTQINSLMREEIYYRERIARDSALIEQLQYDDYLEEYAARTTTCSGATSMSTSSRRIDPAARGRGVPGASDRI